MTVEEAIGLFVGRNGRVWDAYDVMEAGYILAERVEELQMAIMTTLNENPHLADGDDCPLHILKEVMK